MFITYVRNGHRETHAMYQRTLAFLWVWCSEGDNVVIEGYSHAGDA